MNKSGASDPKLDEAVERVEKGEDSAFQDVVEATSARLLRLGARMMGTVADAEDVVQEAYVKAYRSLISGQFDRRAKVETWLYRIVVNTALDAKRAGTRRPKTGEALAEPGWDGALSAEAHVALRELGELIDGLPGDQQAALVLKVVEGRSSAEVGEILGCSEGAVEQKLVRARTALRQRRESK